MNMIGEDESGVPDFSVSHLPMHIIEGGFPKERGRWHAAILLTPHDSLGKVWYLSRTLASANKGALVAIIAITDKEDEAAMAAARKLSTAVRQLSDEIACYLIMVETRPFSNDLNDIIKKAGIDLLFTNARTANQHNLNSLHCGIAVMRGDRTDLIDDNPDNDDNSISRILVPTSGGPNTVYTFANLLNLTNRNITLIALYIAPAHLGEHEVALGRARLKKTLDYIDADGRIETKLLVTDSVIDGIAGEASKEYDLVIIGASKESSLDKYLFGDIPSAVVRQSKRPIMVMRQEKSQLHDFTAWMGWAWQRIIPRFSTERRSEAYIRIRRSARPTRDFYILITLATIIAALGLIANSGAVIIGAMLVAPLMSPIVGAGLAAVLGDARFMRLTLGAVLRGVLLSILMGMMVGLFYMGKPLTPEIMARTQPSLLDLAIALFSGLAGAYALANYTSLASALPGVSIAAALVPPLAVVGITFVTGRFQESFGALLLFITNFVAISSATAVVLLSLGFRPTVTEKARRNLQANSARVALLLLIIIAALLAYSTYALTRESVATAHINDVAAQVVTDVVKGTIVDEPLINGAVLSDEPLALSLVIRASENVQHRHVAEIQEQIAIELEREVGLTVALIKVDELDPFEPPTKTPTPVIMPTKTAVLTHALTTTATSTAKPTTFTPSPTPMLTLTLTATATMPAPTPTATQPAYPAYP